MLDGKRNVQAFFWENNAYNAVIFTDGEYWIVFDGDSQGRFDGKIDLYGENTVNELRAYISENDFNYFDDMYNQFEQDISSLSPAVGKNFGKEFDKSELTHITTIYED